MNDSASAWFVGHAIIPSKTDQGYEVLETDAFRSEEEAMEAHDDIIWMSTWPIYIKDILSNYDMEIGRQMALDENVATSFARKPTSTSRALRFSSNKILKNSRIAAYLKSQTQRRDAYLKLWSCPHVIDEKGRKIAVRSSGHMWVTSQITSPSIDRSSASASSRSSSSKSSSSGKSSKKHSESKPRPKKSKQASKATDKPPRPKKVKIYDPGLPRRYTPPFPNPPDHTTEDGMDIIRQCVKDELERRHIVQGRMCQEAVLNASYLSQWLNRRKERLQHHTYVNVGAVCMKWLGWEQPALL